MPEWGVGPARPESPSGTAQPLHAGTDGGNRASPAAAPASNNGCKRHALMPARLPQSVPCTRREKRCRSGASDLQGPNPTAALLNPCTQERTAATAPRHRQHLPATIGVSGMRRSLHGCRNPFRAQGGKAMPELSRTCRARIQHRHCSTPAQRNGRRQPRLVTTSSCQQRYARRAACAEACTVAAIRSVHKAGKQCRS